MLRLFARVPRPSAGVRAFAASTKKGRAAAKKAALTNAEEEVPTDPAASPSTSTATTATTAAPAAKSTPLGLALRHIETTFGKGALMKLGAHRAGVPADVISTGSLSLDLALGIGGLPRGRVVEIYGPESSGKTTLALHVIAEAQRRGGKCTLIDAENALDPLYAKSLGVNVDELYVSQPDCNYYYYFFFFNSIHHFFFFSGGEQALEICDTLVKSGGMDVIVIDSVAALVPRAELEGEMGDTHMGLQARMMSQALRKITSNLGKANCLVIFLNQIRMKIGVMFGNPETTPGGQALRFFSSIRLDIRRTGKLTRGDEQIGNQVKVKVIKNKMAPPFKEVEIDVEFGKGFRKESELITLAVQYGLVKKAGAWYSLDGKPMGQGREGATAFLMANKDIAVKMEADVRKAHQEATAQAESQEADKAEGDDEGQEMAEEGKA